MIRSFLLETLDIKTVIIFIITAPLFVNFITPIKKMNRGLFYTISIGIAFFSAFITYKLGIHEEPIILSKAFVFSFDRYSWLFTILVNLCWCLTLLYSASYLRFHFTEKAETFHRYLSAAISLSLGAGMAGNFFSLFFFYMVAIPIIYPLITIRGDTEILKAGKNYLIQTLSPALLIVAPVVFLFFPVFRPFTDYEISNLGYSNAQASILLGLLVIGFSKNSVMPFHLWLPQTAKAPAPVTAMVHSVAAVQTSTIALFKIAHHVYGHTLLSDLGDHFFQTGWLIYLCGSTAVYTAYRAWKTPDLKQRFSFSTVGQLSYIITAILVGSPRTTHGAMLHIVTHSLAKLNLFFCAGIYLTFFGSVQGPIVAKWITRNRWVGLAGVISGLSICGFPFLAGYYSKDLMLLEEINRHHYAAASFLVVGSMLNFVYIWPLIKATFLTKNQIDAHPVQVPWQMKLAIGICVIFILSFSKYVYKIVRILQ